VSELRGDKLHAAAEEFLDEFSVDNDVNEVNTEDLVDEFSEQGFRRSPSPLA
jgi:hypothetical protein